MSFDVEGRYGEIFDLEVKSWCYGIEQYPGEIHSGLVHSVVAELHQTFINAFQYGHTFDILDVSLKLSKAAQYLVHEKEICFSIVAQFPAPQQLNEDGQFTMAQVIDKAEQAYGGVLERLEKKWAREKKKTLKAA